MLTKPAGATLATIIAIAFIAAVGVAYAYSAGTESSGNESTVGYVTLTQNDGSGSAKYSFGDAVIPYTTTKSGSEFCFKLVDPVEVGGFTAAKIGGDVVIHAASVGNIPGESLVLSVTSADMKAGDGWLYILKSGDDYCVLDNDGSDPWSGSFTIPYEANAWTDITVSLYYGCLTSDLVNGYLHSVPPTDLTAEGSIVFTANLGVALNKELMTVSGKAGSTDSTLKARTMGIDSKELVWSSSDESIAKVSGGVITLEGAGTATITVSVVDGGVKYSDNCVVNVTIGG
jgi:uncharacterized protein YjdB